MVVESELGEDWREDVKTCESIMERRSICIREDQRVPKEDSKGRGVPGAILIAFNIKGIATICYVTCVHAKKGADRVGELSKVGRVSKAGMVCRGRGWEGRRVLSHSYLPQPPPGCSGIPVCVI